MMVCDDGDGGDTTYFECHVGYPMCSLEHVGGHVLGFCRLQFY